MKFIKYTLCAVLISQILVGRDSYSSYDCHGRPLDVMLVDIMGIQNGVFVEVGAYDGLFTSNTKLLAEKHGWTGVLIEPAAGAFASLVANRPESRCFQCALGSFEENNKYAYGDFSNGPMSSFTGRVIAPQNDLVLIRTLQSILDECNITHINFFSLDTEGYELNILNGIDFQKTTFDYLLIEIYRSQFDSIVSFLASKGYNLLSNMTNYNKTNNPDWDGTHNDYLFKRLSLN